MDDPMEMLIESALQYAGVKFIRDDENSEHLDFYLPNVGVHIEVKQFHSDRVAEQMSRAPNVIVAQGKDAVDWLAQLIRCSFR